MTKRWIKKSCLTGYTILVDFSDTKEEDRNFYMEFSKMWDAIDYFRSPRN